MREIKFRAWDKVTRQFVTSFTMTSNGHIELWVGDGSGKVREPQDFDVLQYTGLKDKNGDKDIYEGDIVEEPGSRYEVVYHADGFYMRDMYEPDNMLIQLRHGYLHCEVIGNIYENPELKAVL